MSRALLAGALKLRHINRVSTRGENVFDGEERLLEDLGQRIRALIPGPDGLIYYSTDSGGIFRIRPARAARHQEAQQPFLVAGHEHGERRVGSSLSGVGERFVTALVDAVPECCVG